MGGSVGEGAASPRGDAYGALSWREITPLLSPHDAYAWKLYRSDPVRRSIIRQAIDHLQLPASSRGLDAGCGIGLQSMLLAEAVGPRGRVTGLDASRPFLDCGKAIASRAGYGQRIAFRQGDIGALPFENGTFDWIWSADCAGYGARRPLSLIKELARVVRPRGTLALLFYSSQQLLPGHPRLEARLNATAAGIAPFEDGMAPEEHYLRAAAWFERAGLEHPRGHTFISVFQAPLPAEVRAALLDLIEMRWPGAPSELAPADGELFERLTDPSGQDFILDLPGYHGFFTETMFWAKTPG